MFSNLVVKVLQPRSGIKATSTGFTVAELIIAISVFSLLTPVIIFTLGGFYDDMVTSLATTTQDTDTRSAASRIVADLNAATGFRASLNVASTNPIGISISNTAVGTNNWSYCGLNTSSVACDDVIVNDYSKKRVLIAYFYATDKSLSDASAMPVFVNNGTAFSLSTSTLATNAYIYFVAPDPTNAQKNNLYRRTITNVNATTDTKAATGLYSSTGAAGSIYQKQTCTASVVATYPSVCGAGDAVLLYDVESFWVDYYDQSNAKITNYYTSNATNAAAAASSISTSAKSIKITVTKKSNNNYKRSISSVLVQRQ